MTKGLILLVFSGLLTLLVGCGNAAQQKSCRSIHQEKLTLPNGRQVLKEICEVYSE